VFYFFKVFFLFNSFIVKNHKSTIIGLVADEGAKFELKNSEIKGSKTKDAVGFIKNYYFFNLF
jgi:hypothetical protein